LTVLLADDEERLRQIVVLMIEELGARVIAVGSCEEALDIFLSRPGEIDLLMLDLRMGGMGGAEAFGRIMERAPGTAVVLSSGVRPARELLDELARHGGDFIEKPFDMDQLGMTLAAVAARTGRASPRE
jgi:DNA-binding NtrC family response regulator